MLQELVRERQALAVRIAELDGQITIALAALAQSDVHQDHELIDVKKASRRLGISSVYCYELCRTKQIPSVRIGRSVRIKPSDLDTYLNRRTT